MRRVIKFVPILGIAVIEVDDNELSSAFVKANIGTSDGTSWMEQSNFFNIPGISIVLDEEGKLKSLPPSLRIPGDVIAGDCIIVSLEKINADGEYGWFGLNDEQFVLVVEEVIF